MTISTKDELVQFMQTYFHELTDIQYVEIMSSTLGIYESQKPNDLSQLLQKIDEYGAYLETLPPDVETPLFWYDDLTLGQNVPMLSTAEKIAHEEKVHS
jgi:hypothetical protein